MAGASEVVVTLPGGRRVDAQVGPHVVRTDQATEMGGEGSAPTPFELFLASMATCAGIFVQGFCAKRDIPTEGIRIVERTENDPQTGVLRRVEIEVQLPAGFPEKYRDAVLRAVDLCSVKRAIQAQPTLEVRTTTR
jgi:ribosomal protein S12 methylthiotransferase accessory factor